MLEPDDLRTRAETVLAWHRAGNPLARALNGEGRPLLIEFAGTPKSGKTSCIESVRHFFHRMGFRVASPAEGASQRIPGHLKRDLTAFNAWNASYAMTQVIEITSQSDRFDIGILDRGLFDTVAWFELLAGRGDIEREKADVVQQFVLLENWRGAIDVVALMQADPGDCMKRENRDKLVKKAGQAMNPDFLAELNTVYDRVAEKYSDLFNLFLKIDTSHDTPLKESAKTVVDLTLGIWESQM